MNGLSFSLTEDHCNNKNTIASKEAELAQQIREISFEHLLLYTISVAYGHWASTTSATALGVHILSASQMKWHRTQKLYVDGLDGLNWILWKASPPRAPCSANKGYSNKRLAYENGSIYFKHRKNCECCPVSLLNVRLQILSTIKVLNWQNCSQCLKCHNSLALSGTVQNW